MGSRRFAIVVVVLLASASPAWAAGSPDVAALQVALHERGAYAGAIDGLLGPATRGAVTAFQRRAGLAADGVADPRTRAALGRFGRPRLGARLLRLGAVGADVAALQFSLAWHGAPSGVLDGRFGPHVDAALRRFQRAAGLAPDGIAGPLTVAALGRPVPAPQVALARPLAGLVTNGFGPRGDRFHTGIDIAAPTGAPVAAAASGRVAFAGWRDGGWGLAVVVAHGNGVRTLYAHLSAVRVRVGARVGTGTTLGLVGATGNARGPHLHFEVRVRGLAVDPSPLVG